jgi:hypothetical protein
MGIAPVQRPALTLAPTGPLVQNVKDQHAKTADELSALAASRRPPSHGTATGQPLTHYHSFFSELLSWNNPSMWCPLFSGIMSRC